MAAQRRLLLTREEGITLVELLIAMSIMSIVMVIFSTVLVSMQRTVVAADRISRANDQARLAIEQLDKELRSGNVISDPSAAISGYTGGAPAYQRLLIYTQANSTARGGSVCELWQINSLNELQARTWLPGEDTWQTSWRTVAEDVVNRTTGTRAFQLTGDALKGNRTLNIHLAVNPDYTHHPSSTIELESSLTGRNTSYNYPTSICQTLPSAA
jgi:type II secretory pathway pseudopilin PulG